MQQILQTTTVSNDEQVPREQKTGTEVRDQVDWMLIGHRTNMVLTQTANSESPVYLVCSSLLATLSLLLSENSI